MYRWVIRSLRNKIIAAVLLSAVLPMALTGAWVAQSASRSARRLLESQLSASLDVLAQSVEKRWRYRHGELLLAAGNAVVQRTLTGGQPSALDSLYMQTLFASLQPLVSSLTARTTGGDARWQLGARLDDLYARHEPLPGMTVRLPITDAEGVRIGTLDALLAIDALLPIDSMPVLLPGATLAVVERVTGRVLQTTTVPMTETNDLADTTSTIHVMRDTPSAPISLHLSAAAAAYVRPFERAATIGLLALATVTITVIALSAYFATRLTRSLEQLSNAADAVSRGNLERFVGASGPDEVGRLATAFNGMTESLRRTLRELSHKESLAAVGEFAASLSHEVRNGLTSMQLDIQHLRHMADDPVRIAPVVDRMFQNVRRLDATVTAALTVARASRTPLARIDLRDIVQAAASSVESAFLMAGTPLRIGPLARDPCFVDGDAPALERLLINLLLNAAQALGTGGEAFLEVDVRDDHAVITVRDTGRGIHDVASVGLPFESSKPGGTGLGLTIVRKIAESHGGKIDIESEVGCGTTVRVTLPRATTAPSPPSSQAASGTPHPHTG